MTGPRRAWCSAGMNVLVLNAGSSTLKAKVLDGASGRSLLAMSIERVGSDGLTHESAFAQVLERAAAHVARVKVVQRVEALANRGEVEGHA